MIALVSGCNPVKRIERALLTDQSYQRFVQIETAVRFISTGETNTMHISSDDLTLRLTAGPPGAGHLLVTLNNTGNKPIWGQMTCIKKATRRPRYFERLRVEVNYLDPGRSTTYTIPMRHFPASTNNVEWTVTTQWDEFYTSK